VFVFALLLANTCRSEFAVILLGVTIFCENMFDGGKRYFSLKQLI
jgi:hypothetical protein